MVVEDFLAEAFFLVTFLTGDFFADFFFTGDFLALFFFAGVLAADVFFELFLAVFFATLFELVPAAETFLEPFFLAVEVLVDFVAFDAVAFFFFVDFAAFSAAFA